MNDYILYVLPTLERFVASMMLARRVLIVSLGTARGSFADCLGIVPMVVRIP